MPGKNNDERWLQGLAAFGAVLYVCTLTTFLNPSVPAFLLIDWFPAREHPLLLGSRSDVSLSCAFAWSIFDLEADEAKAKLVFSRSSCQHKHILTWRSTGADEQHALCLLCLHAFSVWRQRVFISRERDRWEMPGLNVYFMHHGIWNDSKTNFMFGAAVNLHDWVCGNTASIWELRLINRSGVILFLHMGLSRLVQCYLCTDILKWCGAAWS